MLIRDDETGLNFPLVVIIEKPMVHVAGSTKNHRN